MPTACSRLTGHQKNPCIPPCSKKPSKKKGPSEQKSKKAIAEAKRIRAADQTFGIKNKGKSAKAKQYVSRVEHSLTGNEKKAQQTNVRPSSRRNGSSARPRSGKNGPCSPRRPM